MGGCVHNNLYFPAHSILRTMPPPLLLFCSILQICKLREVKKHDLWNRIKTYICTQVYRSPTLVSLPAELCYFSLGGGRVGEPSQTHISNNSANNPRKLTGSLKSIHRTMEPPTMCSHSLFYRTLTKQSLSFIPLILPGKQTFSKFTYFLPQMLT